MLPNCRVIRYAVLYRARASVDCAPRLLHVHAWDSLRLLLPPVEGGGGGFVRAAPRARAWESYSF